MNYMNRLEEILRELGVKHRLDVKKELKAQAQDDAAFAKFAKHIRHLDLAEKDKQRRIAQLKEEIAKLEKYGVSCCGRCHGEGYDNYSCSCHREWDCNA